MGTGIVEDVGTGVDNFKVGQKVYFRAGEGMSLEDGTPVSTVSGTHCSHAVITPNTTHGADHLGPGCDMETSSMFVMPAVGLNGVNMSNPGMGEVVVIHGCGLIGFGALAACVHRGCVVIAVDMKERQLELAKAFGADHVIDASREDVLQAVEAISPGGADVVFECTGLPKCIDSSITLCRLRGKFIWQGNYGAEPFPFHFLNPHGRQLKMFFPCDDGLWPCRRAVLRNMASGALAWDKLITHKISCHEAPEVFEAINNGQSDVLGLTINWN
jgi:3-hydroxyethyl bacteriochlorophyllide a dehydrogenase